MICGTSGRDGNQMTDTMKCQGKGVGAVWTAGPVQFIPGREVRCGKVRKEQRRRVLLFCLGLSGPEGPSE